MNHLNIFEHYEQKDSIPLENNLTRIFARILKDNYYVANNFFRLIISKLELSDNYNDDNIIEILTQKSISYIKKEYFGNDDKNDKKN